MTGIGEAGLVLGLVSSSIAIFEAAQEIYEAASDISGLPKKLRLAAEQIPLVYHALTLAKQNIDANKITEEMLQNVKPVLEQCERSAAGVKDIFEKNIAPRDASRAERLRKAVGAKIKGSKVKEYMEEIFKNMELLAQNQVFQDAETLEDIKGAIEQLTNVSDNEGQPQFVHSGGGSMNTNTGGGTQENNSNSGPGTQYNAQNQYFGRDQAGANRETISASATSADFHYTPLMWAIHDDNEAGYEELLEFNVDVMTRNKSKNNHTPLHEAACWSKNGKSVRSLLAAGAKLEARTAQLLYTPLLTAVKTINEKTVRKLLEAGADVEASTWKCGIDVYPLLLAAHHGSLPIVEMLLAHGANPCHRAKHLVLLGLGSKASGTKFQPTVSKEQRARIRKTIKDAQKNGHHPKVPYSGIATSVPNYQSYAI